jgi:hypothetical protein
MINGSVFNVKDFGAVGDGISDDTAAIQAALDAAGVISISSPPFPGYGYLIKGGSTVFIPAGKYLTSFTVTVPQNVSVDGAGKNSTILKSSYDGDILRTAGVPTVAGTYDVAGIALRNFSIIGDRTKPNQVGFDFLRLVSATVENLCVSECGSHGFLMRQCGVNRFDNIEAIYNVGDGVRIQQGVFSWNNMAPNGMPSNANVFTFIRCLQNDGAGLRVTTGSSGNIFLGANCEYNYWTSGDNIGYNIHIDTNGPQATTLYSPWTEGPAQYHVYVENSDIGIPVKIIDWRHFGNGASGTVDRALGVDTGTVILDGANGQSDYYKTISGSNSPFRIINKTTAVIRSTANRGSLVNGIDAFEDATGSHSGLLNNLKFDGSVSDGISFGPQTLFNDFGSPNGFALQNDTQAYAWMQLRSFNRDLLLGDGTAVPDAGLRRVSAGQIGPRAGDFLNAGSAWNGSHLVMGTYHLWVDGTGDLRIKSSAPTSDIDGAVVGTQT